MQFESYMPPLTGYPLPLEGTGIFHRFLRFRKGIIDITAGNFYEQFGSGLIYRSFEDRSLGINNSTDGIRIILKPLNWIRVKGVYGKQRIFNDYSGGYIRGIDSDASLSNAFEWDNTLDLGIGILSKYEPYTGPDPDFPSTVNAVSARIRAEYRSISLSTEYVNKSDDPSPFNTSVRVGKALKSELSYSRKGLGIFFSVRILQNMSFNIERLVSHDYLGINYTPSNTRHHTYVLSNLYPYTTQAEGEASVQADINYSLKRGSLLGGKYGTKIRLNMSLVNSLADNGESFGFGNDLYFFDINAEINRKWNRRFKTKLFFQNSSYDQAIILGSGETVQYKLLAADLRYSFSDRLSVKSELQHLWTDQHNGNWVASGIELAFAPWIAVFVNDITDYENERIHYLNTGLSYSNSYFRISLGYGRYKEGYVCSGGICRLIPAYTGFNLKLTSSF
jgi:hypothetical protein